MIRISVALACAFAFAVGCGSKKEEKAGATSTAPETAAASGGAAAAAKEVKLPKLGLALDAPGDVNVQDALAGEGHMLTGSGVGALNVTAQAEPQTLDAEKEDAKMYTPTNLKDETLPDGFALTFENKGAMGANYWVVVYRTIDGKQYKCTTTGPDGKQAVSVLAACKSLRKG